MSNSKTEVNNSTLVNENLTKKIVIRRLPPTMTKEQFIEIISPLPDHDYFYYCNADMSLGPYAFCRAYIYINNYEDIFSFRDRFDNYVFVDSKSNEYPAIVEFAPYQRRIKLPEQQKKDSKCNTIDNDSDYLKFLEQFDKPLAADTLPSCEAILEELEQRDRDKITAGLKEDQIITPLLEYMRRKREDKKITLKERERERDAKKRRDTNTSGNKYRDNNRYTIQSNKEKLNQPQNIKIMSKSNSQQQTKTESKQLDINKTANSTNDSKPTSATSGSSNGFNKESSNSSKNSNSSNKMSYSSNRNQSYNFSNNRNFSGGAKNQYEYDNKQAKTQSTIITEKVSEKPKESISNTSGTDKADSKATGLKNKDRPSIQIYNPSQRAAMRQKQDQKQEQKQ